MVLHVFAGTELLSVPKFGRLTTLNGGILRRLGSFSLDENELKNVVQVL